MSNMGQLKKRTLFASLKMTYEVQINDVYEDDDQVPESLFVEIMKIY